MVKVITYGSYDMLHFGHVKLLERAKALGDYLIVGITSDDYDKTRGKINLQQSLAERIEGVRSTGLADLIIVEEYEGQKIDDIRRYDVDIFTIGSDWEGRFDYLNEYCKVIYLPRTEGISSSELRSKERKLRIGFIGDNEGRILNKYCSECKYVNGAEVAGICTTDKEVHDLHGDVTFWGSYNELLAVCDAVYILSHPLLHFEHIYKALDSEKHVLVEMPVTIGAIRCQELYKKAEQNKLILMPAMKTAYATAYNRLLLLAKSGKIGNVISVDSTCTSLRDIVGEKKEYKDIWNSICAWGPTAMLPIFQILGTNYSISNMVSLYLDRDSRFDAFTKADFVYDSSVASIKVGRGAKSEGNLVITGTLGYIYVPAPWWKTDYFEVRYENPENNKRYFYQLEGEGIRYEIVAFIKAIKSGKNPDYISKEVAVQISEVIKDFYDGKAVEITK